jgi:hypothetical protein
MHTNCPQDRGSTSKMLEWGTKKELCFLNEGDNSWKARVNCHNCGKKGHIARECPERKQAINKEQIHANIQEDGSNEDDTDQGKNIFMQKREKGVVNRKLAPTGQPEHGGSSC